MAEPAGPQELRRGPDDRTDALVGRPAGLGMHPAGRRGDHERRVADDQVERLAADRVEQVAGPASTFVTPLRAALRAMATARGLRSTATTFAAVRAANIASTPQPQVREITEYKRKNTSRSPRPERLGPVLGSGPREQPVLS